MKAHIDGSREVLTLFAIPKPFEGHIDVIQRNAIQSWLQLRPACEVILLGDDAGTADVAREFDVRHMPEVARNEYGTPLVNDTFDQAQRAATHDLLCYVNADIILMSDLMEAVERVAGRKRPFLMVGQRWDVDLAEAWKFGLPGWEADLRAYVRKEGDLHPKTGIDYFVFPKGLFDAIPPFALGRTVWDNWLIYRARAQRAAVIDATLAIMAIHQNHDYAHISGGQEAAWGGMEAVQNRELAEGYSHIFTLRDANWLLTPRGLVPALTMQHLRRRLKALPILHPRLHAPVQLLKRVLRGSHRVLSALIHRVKRLFRNRV